MQHRSDLAAIIGLLCLDVKLVFDPKRHEALIERHRNQNFRQAFFDYKSYKDARPLLESQWLWPVHDNAAGVLEAILQAPRKSPNRVEDACANVQAAIFDTTSDSLKGFGCPTWPC